jgi:hypothetical protein
LPNNILLHHFHLGLRKEDALLLDITLRGSFLHKTISEGKAILEKILENTPTQLFLMSFLKKSNQAPTNKRRHTQPNPNLKILQNLLIIWLPKKLPLRE